MADTPGSEPGALFTQGVGVRVSLWSLFCGRASAQSSLISLIRQVQLLGPQLISRSGLEAGPSSVSYAVSRRFKSDLRD